MWLTRFSKTEVECETIQDKILFTLKNRHELKNCPRNFKERELRDIFEITRISNFNCFSKLVYNLAPIVTFPIWFPIPNSQGGGAWVGCIVAM
jgi:hypothetical protein